MVWTCGMLQWCNQDSLWHTGWWKTWAWEAQNDIEAADRGIAESGSSRLSTLMIDVLGDLVWDLPCVQQASYLEGGPLMWMLPLYLHVIQKSDYDMIWYLMVNWAKVYKVYVLQMIKIRHRMYKRTTYSPENYLLSKNKKTKKKQSFLSVFR